MSAIPEAWKALAVVTVQTIEQINEKSGSDRPLSRSVLEFAQFLGLLAVAGSRELDGKERDEDDKGNTGQGSSEDT